MLDMANNADRALLSAVHRSSESLERIADAAERISDLLAGIIEGLTAEPPTSAVPDEVLSNIDQLGEQDD